MAELCRLDDRLIRLAALGQDDAPHVEAFGGVSDEPLGGFDPRIVAVKKCQTARKRDPLWAPKRDPFFTVFERRGA